MADEETDEELTIERTQESPISTIDVEEWVNEPAKANPADGTAETHEAAKAAGTLPQTDDAGNITLRAEKHTPRGDEP
jgi:hypothetical protein